MRKVIDTFWGKISSLSTCNLFYFSAIVLLAMLPLKDSMAQSYCIPTTTYTGDYTSAFSISNAQENVTYTATSQPSGSFADLTSQTILTAAGESFDFSITYVGGSNGVNIWIDWDDDGIFDPDTELVFYLANSDATKTGSINIPTGTASGTYRLRVRSQFGSTANPAPCGNVSYGSTLDYTLEVAIPGTNDAGISHLVSPVDFCQGTETIKVLVQNLGINKIDSFKLDWELNGAGQTPISINTPLDTLGGTGINEIEVTLGDYTFTGAEVELKVWTYLPNGVTDTVNFNDTISVVLNASLSGNFTVNSADPTAGTNYNNFGDLTDDLAAYGICGPVIVDVVAGSGPYTEVVKFGDIQGASATNYIRINGNGNTVQFTNTSTERQLLTLNGTKHLRIDSLNFKTLATDYGWGALITGGAAYDSLTNCIFDLSSGTSTSAGNFSGIAFSGSITSAVTTGSNGSHCYIADNHILSRDGSGGAYYALTVNGASDSNIIRNNIIENHYNYGIRVDGSTGTQIIGNELHRTNKTAVTTFYGISTAGVTPGLRIEGNKIHHPGGTASSTSAFYGINHLGDGTVSDPIIIANNLIYHVNQGGTVYGIYNSTAPHTKIYHNTIDIAENLSSSSTNYGIYSTGTNPGLEVKNNIVSITGGGTGTKYGFYYSSITSIEDAQKNNFYLNSSQGGTQNYGYYTTAYGSQADFQADYPTWEDESPADDPQFVDRAAADFNVDNSSLIDAGENLMAVIPKDISGNSRPFTPTIGAFEHPPIGSNNAAMVAFISPEGSYCEGMQSVSVSISNAGVNDIDSLKIGWEIDGVAQQTINYVNTLVPINSIGQNMDTVVLLSIPIPAGSPISIKAWTMLPNGLVDTVNANDTILSEFKATAFELTALSDTICSGANAKLNLSPDTGIAVGAIMWQNSTDGITWNDIPNSDEPEYEVLNLTQAMWFRVRIGEATNYCFTDSVKIEVIEVDLTSASGAERCGPGTLDLNAIANPELGINWYEEESGGAPIATGSLFTTPSLLATDTFYVSAATGSVGDVTIGDGAQTSQSGSDGSYEGTSPFAHHYGNYKHQMLITANELIAAGMEAGEINSLAFDVVSVGTATFDNFTISIGGTTNTAMTSAFETGLTTVFTDDVSPIVGINTYAFTAPFIWDGVSNLVVQTCYNNNNSGSVANSAEVKFDPTPFVSHTVYRADGAQDDICSQSDGNSNGDGPTISKRPMMIFEVVSGCESPRLQVIAKINPSPDFGIDAEEIVCNNAITPITVTVGLNDYDEFEWTPITDLYTDAAATVPYVAGISASTVYLKTEIAGEHEYSVIANNTINECSNMDTLNILVQPDIEEVIATPEMICMQGSAVLELNPQLGYLPNSIQWYESADGVSYTAVTGANETTYTTGDLLSGTFFKVILSAGFEECAAIEKVVEVVNPEIISSIDGQRCGPGTVELSAMADQNLEINWYEDEEGGTSIGIGGSFTTPSISETDTFYVSAGVGSGALISTIGDGAMTSVSGAPDYNATSPYAYHYGNYKHQYLIKAEELINAGMSAGSITSLGLDVASVGSNSVIFNDFTVSLKETALNALTTTFETGMEVVFTDDVTPVIGINSYEFTTPFVWDGVSNIVVQTCYNNNNSGSVSSSAEVKYDNTSFNAHYVYRADNTQNDICSRATSNVSEEVNRRPVFIFESIGGCHSPRVPVIATINSLPVIDLGDDEVIVCDGSPIILDAGNAGMDFLWNDNSANQTLTVVSAGVYEVTVTDNATGCSASASIEVGEGANPVDPFDPVANLCVGDTIALDAGNLGSAYEWGNSETTQLIEVSEEGQYTVTITTTDGCSMDFSTEVVERELPIVDLGNDTTICMGETVILDAGNSSSDYSWNTGAGTQIIDASDSGTYSVVVTDQYNCFSSDEIKVSYFENPYVEGFNFIPTIHDGEGQQFDFSPLNPENVISYEWDFGDGSPVSTEENPSHVFLNTDVYSVTLKVTNDCDSYEVSLSVNVDLTGITVIAEDAVDIKLYPNPAKHVITVENKTKDLKIEKISIYSSLGSLVNESELQDDKQVISVGNLASGVYMAKIQTDKGIVVKRFEVIR